MKKINILSLIVFGAVIVVISMIIALTEGNYYMLKNILSESNNIVTFIKAFGFSIAAMIIIVYDRRKIVKLLFVVLDTSLVFSLIYFDNKIWSEVGAFIYAPYVGLNLYFVGMILTNELSKYQETRKEDDKFLSLENTIQALEKELIKTHDELKTTNAKLETTKGKLNELFQAKLVNARRGRGDKKEENIRIIKSEIDKYINFKTDSENEES